MSKTWHNGVNWTSDLVSATPKIYSKNGLTHRLQLFFIFVWLWRLFKVVSKTWRDGVKWTPDSILVTPNTYKKHGLTPKPEMPNDRLNNTYTYFTHSASYSNRLFNSTSYLLLINCTAFFNNNIISVIVIINVIININYYLLSNIKSWSKFTVHGKFYLTVV